jgi:hypothetical protein
MLKLIKSFFKKTAEPAPAPVAEYKVETPVTAPVVAVGEPPAIVVVEGAGEVAILAPAKKPRAPKKPKAETAPAAKKPRAPRKPKAAK